MLDENVIELITKDIERCKRQTTNEGSFLLYQALIGKYNGLFPGFSNDIPKMAKLSTGGASNYLPEINAIKEKLELLLVTEQANDPLFKFKEMVSTDIDELKRVMENYDEIDEKEKLHLYMSITARYHPYVPQLGDGLYQYHAQSGFYDEVSGSSLEHNLSQVYNKLITFKTLNYPGLGKEAVNTHSALVNITNPNENNNENTNTNTMMVSFESVREKVSGMTSLPDEDIEEIQNKINELEEIVNSKDSKSKKWSKAKDVIKWVADKGVDVGIALLPLILKIN